MMKEMEKSVSPETLAKRLRNRIIEHLELVASFEEQAQYQHKVPIANVPAEVICGWEDWVPEIEGVSSWAIDPIFNSEERDAIAFFDKALNSIIEKLPQVLPTLQDLFLNPYWNELSQKSANALAIFSKRGRISED